MVGPSIPWAGGDPTVCLGDEQVTQHRKELGTDAFDIVIGTDFLRRNPQVKLLSLQRPHALSLRLWQWPFLCPSGPAAPRPSSAQTS